MAQISAGILMYHFQDGILEVFLAHPGGPFFRNKNYGVWTIPKGMPEKDEDLFSAALREFEEETGLKPGGDFISLDFIKQKGGKIVHAWAVEGDLPGDFKLRSNFFVMPGSSASGQLKKFPEIDKVEFFPVAIAKEKIIPAQIPLIERLVNHLNSSE
jgi:predicted NUDIX family NTP pyrophosphohydrolase